MRSTKIIHVVSCHAEGEVGDVIVGGVQAPPGATIFEQAEFIARDGTLRRFVLNEPRGGVFRHVNLIVPAKSKGAHFGWIIMEPEDTPPMSGSNAMCVATVLVETGLMAPMAPITEVILEAPGGLVCIAVACRNGAAERVTVNNVPSFIDQLDVPIEVPGIGTVSVDVAYGGDSFGLVDGRGLGFAFSADEARELAEVGVRITMAINEQYRFDAAERTSLKSVSFCQLTAPLEMVDGAWCGTSAVAIRPGKIDRSPCGTGCSARMAVLWRRGVLRPSDTFVGRSILGSKFDCKILRVLDHKGMPAIAPSISGRAWITGIHQHTLDPNDPWPEGYRLADTWPRLC